MLIASFERNMYPIWRGTPRASHIADILRYPSWSVPRGLSMCMGIPCLAISVETSTRSEFAVSTTMRSGFTSSKTRCGVKHG